MINPLFHRSTFQGDLFITLLNGIGVLAGVFLLNGLMARVMGIDALGEFLLVRRTAFTLIGVFLLGMSIGIPYYVSQEEDNSYGAAALLLFLLITLPFIGLVSGALHLGLLHGFPPELVLPFFIFTAGYALQLLTYSLLRGHLNMLGANLLQLLGTGLMPLVVLFLFHDRGVPYLLLAMGLGTILLSGMVLFARLTAGAYSMTSQKIWQLLVYGARRIPGFVAQFILLGGVPLLILRDAGKAEIAYVNSGISFITLFLVVVGPLGIVLLPRISRALAAGQKARIARGLDVLGKTTLLASIPLALFLSVNSLVLVRIWLGSEGEPGARIVQLLVLSLPFYLLKVVFRSPIDAASTRGYNSIANSAAALVLLLVFYGLKAAGLTSIDAGIFGFIAGHITAAIGGLYYTSKLYGVNLISPVYLATVLGAIILSTLFFPAVNLLVPGIVSLVIGGIALVTVLGLFFWKARIDWVIDLRSLVLVR